MVKGIWVEGERLREEGILFSSCLTPWQRGNEKAEGRSCMPSTFHLLPFQAISYFELFLFVPVRLPFYRLRPLPG